MVGDTPPQQRGQRSGPGLLGGLAGRDGADRDQDDRGIGVPLRDPARIDDCLPWVTANGTAAVLSPSAQEALRSGRTAGPARYESAVGSALLPTFSALLHRHVALSRTPPRPLSGRPPTAMMASRPGDRTRHDDGTPMPSQTGQPAVVLLAEDDPGDVVMITDAFAQSAAPVQLHVISDGEQAIDYVCRNGPAAPRPALILLDLNMPRRNGFEVPYLCRQRAFSAGSSTLSTTRRTSASRTTRPRAAVRW